MGIVTGDALTFPNRSMHDSLLQALCHILMAGIAQLGRSFLKKTSEPGDMGIMTGEAFPRLDRRMLHLLLEGGTVVTGEAVYGDLGHPRISQEQH
jgi:hypothetical protein